MDAAAAQNDDSQPSLFTAGIPARHKDDN